MTDILPLWTRKRLHDLIEKQLRGWKIIVVSNREPFMHRRTEDGIECIQPAGGMATALRPIMVASGGTWIAHGAGDADRETADAEGRLAVPPEEPAYTLRRVWLSAEQEQGFYYGMANEALWPLCHVTFTRPVFRPEDWAMYREVNEIFAEAVLEEAGDSPAFVFIQDYHFCLLPRILKNSGRTNLVVAQFWHIPWPNRETFRVFPWGEELLDGLLGNDLLGFHIRYHCQNFLDTVDRGIEARVDRETWHVWRGGLRTQVRHFPISIDDKAQEKLVGGDRVRDAMEMWMQRLRLNGCKLGAGIERLDYTKGIPDRLRALDRFFEQHPEWLGRFVFAQIAVPSRSTIESYRKLEQEVDELAAHLNRRWGRGGWNPVVLIKRHHGPAEMTALHRLADFFIVNPLHDGMNLVCKEFVASRTDEKGVLILSKFTGAWRELDEAIGINPYALDETAEAINTALTMDEAEQARRMRRLRHHITTNNIYRWAGKILSTLLHFDLPDYDNSTETALD